MNLQRAPASRRAGILPAARVLAKPSPRPGMRLPDRAIGLPVAFTVGMDIMPHSHLHNADATTGASAAP
jgi:hypothetical protein